ncbi:MAG: hypothetical protein ABH829_01410 [archaeon]
MQGKVILEYVFDVGGEVDLRQLQEKKFKKTPVAEKTLTKKYTDVGLNAVVFELGTTTVGSHTLRVFAEVYPIGEILIKFERDIERHEEAQELVTRLETEEMHKMAQEVFSQMRRKIEPAMVNAYEYVEIVRAYAFLLFKGKPDRGEVWFTQLLRQVKKPSKQEISDCMRHSLSFEEHDLAVIDYMGAVVFDPEGDFGDIVDIINVALVQLIALRTYDTILDKRVLKVYEDMKGMTKRVGLIPSFGKTNKVVKDVAETKIMISDMMEDIANIIKISGDWYLARVYGAASERFRLDGWLRNIVRKMGDLESINVMLYEARDAERASITNALMLIMETLIVVLIVFEIVIFF